MRLIHVMSFLVIFFYFCHESSSEAEQKQPGVTTTTESTMNKPKCSFGGLYHYSKKVIDYFLKLTGSLQELPYTKNLSELLMTNGADICGKSNQTEEIDLLILVDSNVKNSRHRKRIRDTWYNYWVSRVQKVRVVFFVGKPQGAVLGTKLAIENKINRDIVCSNTIDLPVLYGSIKALSWLQWLMTKCDNAKMVLKVDENVILNVPRMMKFVYDNQKTVNTIWGSEFHGRDPDSTGYFLKDGYLMTRDVITKLFHGGLKAKPYISIENIYFTGRVAPMENIKMVDLPEFKGINVATKYYSSGPNYFKNSNKICVHYKNHIIFLTSNNKFEWLYLLATFSTCPGNKL